MESLPKFLEKCELWSDWVEYKGKVYYGQVNYDQSIKSKRVMIDLSYCATKAMNNIIEKTVRFDRGKFNLNPKKHP
jgi:hypothetical protein